jgi:hypothetical protein
MKIYKITEAMESCQKSAMVEKECNYITVNGHFAHSFISKLIRLFSMGRVNHISVEYNGVVYEAVEGRGVIETPVTKWDSSTVVESYTIKIKNKDAERNLRKFIKEQKGKKYDYLGVLSFIWVFLSPKKGKWFCSELGAVAIYKALFLPVGEVDNQRISPHVCMMIARIASITSQ